MAHRNEILPSGFYSPVPSERVNALKVTTEEHRALLMEGLPDWPVMSPGSVNAWLVFIGPSPGNSPGRPWCYDPLPSVGESHPGVSEYVDTRNFWNRIRQFVRQIFSELEPAEAYAATMVRNLHHERSATAPKGGFMAAGADEVFCVLDRLVRPRLIVSIGGARRYTDEAFRHKPGIREFDSGVLYSSIKRNELEWFSLSGTWKSGVPFLYVSAKGIHPSRIHVSMGDILMFLRNQSEEARLL